MPSHSPWRAQVLVDHSDEKNRMVIDYSRTINKFTIQDAYPIPNMDGLALEVSRFSVFSTFDLSSAYHQIPIPDCDQDYTAFEADGRLWNFKVMPFGVTNKYLFIYL